MAAAPADSLTLEEGNALAKEIGAVGYLECSSVSGEGVDEVFKEAIRLALSEDEEEKREKGGWWKRIVGCFGS